MPRKRLTARERLKLYEYLDVAHDVWTYRRIQANLAIGEGQSISSIARRLRVGRQTVHRWAAAFFGPNRWELLVDHRGQGRPRVLDEEPKQYLGEALQHTPQTYGYLHSEWTVPLLQDFLRTGMSIRVSQSTVRRQIHALGYVWKRARYVLRPDPEEEKKTPNSA